jgi:hypothetical protein
LNLRSLFFRRRIECACTVEIENTAESLQAHVELDGDLVLRPGDEVQVIDAPPKPPYGERIVARRRAIVIRASVVGQLWTRLVGPMELTGLYDVSFSEKRFL